MRTQLSAAAVVPGTLPDGSSPGGLIAAPSLPPPPPLPFGAAAYQLDTFIDSGSGNCVSRETHPAALCSACGCNGAGACLVYQSSSGASHTYDCIHNSDIYSTFSNCATPNFFCEAFSPVLTPQEHLDWVRHTTQFSDAQVGPWLAHGRPTVGPRSM